MLGLFIRLLHSRANQIIRLFQSKANQMHSQWIECALLKRDLPHERAIEKTVPGVNKFVFHLQKNNS